MVANVGHGAVNERTVSDQEQHVTTCRFKVPQLDNTANFLAATVDLSPVRRKSDRWSNTQYNDFVEKITTLF